MRIAVTADAEGGTLRPVGEEARPVGDLAAAMGEIETADRPRWIWADTREVYPTLLARGLRLARCHDLTLTESLLLGHEGRYGEPRSAAAAHARLRGLPVPGDAAGPHTVQDTLFLPEPAEVDVLDVHADQLRRIEATGSPSRFRLLVAAESAGALIAAEMGHDGMPWREDVHDELLTGLLGPRPVHGMRPSKLQALADQVSAAFGGSVNPDSPQQIVKAFKSAGLAVPSTRSHVLKQVDHPAVAPLLAYKELARLYSFHGWTWAHQWVREASLPSRVRRGRSGVGPVGHQRRRRAADSEGDAASGRRRRGLAAGGRRRARSSSRGCWRRWPETAAWHAPPEQIDLYPRSPRHSAARATAPRSPCCPRCTAAPAATRRNCWRSCGSGSRRRTTSWRTRAQAGEEGRLVRSWLGRTCPPPSAPLARPRLRARGGPSRPRPGPLHPQLRGPGHRGRVGADPDGPAPRAAARLRPGSCSSSTTR